MRLICSPNTNTQILFACVQSDYMKTIHQFWVYTRQVQSGLLMLRCRVCRLRSAAPPYCMPLPMRSGSNSPVSIFASMVLEHLRKASSTFSPVLALVSRKISSKNLVIYLISICNNNNKAFCTYRFPVQRCWPPKM